MKVDEPSEKGEKPTSAQIKYLKMREQHILFLGSKHGIKDKAIRLMCEQNQLKKTAGLHVIDRSSVKDLANLSALQSIDYGEIQLDSGEKIHLIDIDQVLQMSLLKRHWSNKALGIILLIDLDTDDPLEEMESTLMEFSPYFHGMSLAIGVVNNNDQQALNFNAVHARLHDLKFNVPLFEVSIDSYTDVSLLIQSMLILNLYGVTCEEKLG